MARTATLRAGLPVTAGTHLLVAAAYLLAAAWATEFGIGGSVLIWFPPAGVAVGAIALGGWRFVPTLAVAEAASTIWVTGFAEEFGPALLALNTALIIGAYTFGAMAMRRARTDPELRTTADLLHFVVYGAVGASLLAAVGGIATQVLADLVATDDALREGAIFFVGDMVGVAAVAPPLLVVGGTLRRGAAPRVSDRPGSRAAWLAVVEETVPALVALVLFAQSEDPVRFLYLTMVPLTVVALRHGVCGAALSSLGLCAVMTIGADAKATDTLDRSDLQMLMGTASLLALTVGTVVTERAALLRQSRTLGAIVEATPDLVGTADRDGRLRYLNPVGRELLGLAPDAELGQLSATDFTADDISRELLSEAIRAAQRDGVWRGENAVRSHDGRVIPVSQVVVAHPVAAGPDGVVTEQLSTIIRDIGPQRTLEDQLRRAALVDDTTELPNRAVLVDHVARLLDAPSSGDDPRAAVVLVDIDRFGVVNQSLGYRTGDEVLAVLARRLRAAARPGDLVARHGGDRFAVVMEDLPDELEVLGTTAALVRAVAEPLDVDGRRLVLSASVGATTATDGGEALDVIRAAEVALHRAKEEGGGRVRIFDEDMDRRTKDRLALESDLRRAIDTGEWRLAYQPVVDAVSGEVTGCEALLRWSHPERGNVSPFEVVVLAEATGLIVPLGHGILERACGDAQRFAGAGHALTVSVNVSRHQLTAPGFAEDVEAVLGAAGIAPSAIVIEVTETALGDDTAGIAAVLRHLRGLGCRIAMDDFGTGYSSLATLRDLPIDVVKLDRSFITDLGAREETTATVDAVIRLASALHLDVVAEGVERPEQLECLRELGCGRIQGFLVSEAVPGDDLLAMLDHPPLAGR